LSTVLWNFVSHVNESTEGEDVIKQSAKEYMCSRIGCWGRYFGIRNWKFQDIRENCIMISLISCDPQRTLSGWSNQEGETGNACGQINIYMVLVGKHKGKRLFGKPRQAEVRYYWGGS
jgi:hypothetical protein